MCIRSVHNKSFDTSGLNNMTIWGESWVRGSELASWLVSVHISCLVLFSSRWNTNSHIYIYIYIYVCVCVCVCAVNVGFCFICCKCGFVTVRLAILTSLSLFFFVLSVIRSNNTANYATTNSFHIVSNLFTNRRTVRRCVNGATDGVVKQNRKL